MSKTEVMVTFRTITPLWTGDAWQENEKIRPSSLIGSLRFWFEVLMYFCGVLKKGDFQSGRFEKEVNRDELNSFIKENGNNLTEIVKHLLENQKIPISSIIFGTTNWRSLIEIKSIKELEDYCYGNKLNLDKICISKLNGEIKEGKDCPKKSNQYWSVFHFSMPYFYGQFKVTFSVAEEILEPIFYPLLNFMDKYGYWGGKWNIGYGRLKVIEVGNNEKISEKKEIDLTVFNKEKVNIDNLVMLPDINDINDFNGLLDRKTKKIKIIYANLNNQSHQRDLGTLIKNLIKIKIQERKNITNQKDRHYIFGKTGNIEGEDLPQGSKILPFIEEENGQLKGGFLSIAGLLDLY